MFSCVGIESPFIFVTVAILNSVLQKQFTSSVSCCVVGCVQNRSSIFVVIIAWLGDCENRERVQ